MALGSTQPLTGLSTRNLLGCKGRPALRADKLTAIFEPTVWTKCGNLDVSQPCGSSRPVTRIALLLLLLLLIALFLFSFCVFLTRVHFVIGFGLLT
jgi:hypothetical protein